MHLLDPPYFPTPVYPDAQRTMAPPPNDVRGGRAIKPASVEAGRYIFVLPTIDGTVRLVSRAGRPCDLRPWVEDRRRLGVMVSRLTLRRGTEVHPIPLDHPDLSCGWWDIEGDPATARRWTDGDARIGLSAEGPVVLEIVLAGGMDYALDEPLEAVPARATGSPRAPELVPGVARVHPAAA